MKLFFKLSFVFLISLNAYSHSVQVQYCINCNGDLETDFDNELVIPETESLECDSCKHYQYYEVEEPLYCDGEFHGNNGKVFCNNCVEATQ